MLQEGVYTNVTEGCVHKYYRRVCTQMLQKGMYTNDKGGCVVNAYTNVTGGCGTRPCKTCSKPMTGQSSLFEPASSPWEESLPDTDDHVAEDVESIKEEPVMDEPDEFSPQVSVTHHRKPCWDYEVKERQCLNGGNCFAVELHNGMRRSGCR